MKIKQIEDKNLAHYSYAILSECEKKIVVIDPARQIQPYLQYAKENDATIIGIIETHPHADFTSGHLELKTLTDATIYVSKKVGAAYPHQSFDEGEEITFGKIKLKALNTPGHSPDSISIVLTHDGKQKAVFTGDTLFIGDCGRPDLRSDSGDAKGDAEELAKQMYHSLRNKLMPLPDDVAVYPAHGAGTLCGKNLSKESSSTIGKEKETNWSLQEATEEDFVKTLLDEQPFVPQYFPFDVELNKKGLPPLQQSIDQVPTGETVSKDHQPELSKHLWIIDTREGDDFKKGHLPKSINLSEDGKFETWLGSIIGPEEKFYLAGKDKEQLQSALQRVAAIGYEGGVEKAFIITSAEEKEASLNVEEFKKHPDHYTIVDVRNKTEREEEDIFSNSLSIPLAEVRERVNEIPKDKPVVVHCSGGYRSAAASSIIHSSLNGKVQVFDLGEAVKDFQKQEH